MAGAENRTAVGGDTVAVAGNSESVIGGGVVGGTVSATSAVGCRR